MSRTLRQIEKDGYDTLTKDEINNFKNTMLLLHDAIYNKWPTEFGEAYDIFLKNYGWHLRLWMHPNDLISYMKQGNDEVDKYFIKKLRWNGFRLRWLAIKRFPHRRKMINSAFISHLIGNYTSSIPLFLLLSEGIFRELTGEDLFAKKRSSKISNVVEQRKNIKITPLMTHIINAVSNGDIIGLRFSDDEYLKYPNVLSRNKILHGADYTYGTKVNAYKAISQFEFVVESVHLALSAKK